MPFQGFLLAVVMSLGLAQAPAKETPRDYVLGTEDVITVVVIGHPEFSGEYFVPSAGIIQFPVVGSVNVQGMTLGALTTRIRDGLKSRLLKPEVSTTLKMARLQRVYVLGDVRLPGIYDLKSGWRIAEVISAAGGLALGTQTTDVKVTLEHGGSTVLSETLPTILNAPESPRYRLTAGDVLRVDSVALLPVYVVGRVHTPGIYHLRADGMTVLAAIAQAGGLGDAPATSSVNIAHSDGTQETVDLTPFLSSRPNSDAGTKPPEPKLRAGDMVTVPESLNRFAVIGNVQKPGPYPIPDGERYTLSDAIALSGGTSALSGKQGLVSKIGVVHRTGTKDICKVYNLAKYLHNGDVSQNPRIMPGDIVYVPISNHVDLETLLSELSSAALLNYYLRH